ncbi:MAG: hypothetical protein ABC578_06265 [Candidatus Methanosuratincola petrocarbonis]
MSEDLVNLPDSSWTKAELLAYCADNGIEASDSWTKAEILAAIEAAQSSEEQVAEGGTTAMTYTVKNVSKLVRNVCLPGPDGKLSDSRFLQPRETLVLNEEQFQSPRVQAMLRQGILRLVKAE